MLAMQSITVHVPATTANLGPGFDSLGLALDLWNQATFELIGNGIQVEIHGEGKERLATDTRNLIAQAALKVYAITGNLPVIGLKIRCQNCIPLGSGLGSSAGAVLAGLMGANALLDNPLDQEQILDLATEMEGHPDNVAPGLFGSLVISTTLIPEPTDNRPPIVARRVTVPMLETAVVVPAIDLPTKKARAALPVQVAIRDAVFNIGRVALVVEALRSGDLDLLGKVMDDRLHQPYRFKLIQGADEAVQAAHDAGASAVALSGAGPGIVAFTKKGANQVVTAMINAFGAVGVNARGWVLKVAENGAWVEKNF